MGQASLTSCVVAMEESSTMPFCEVPSLGHEKRAVSEGERAAGLSFSY
jgi:hypothetical protein